MQCSSPALLNCTKWQLPLFSKRWTHWAVEACNILLSQGCCMLWQCELLPGRHSRPTTTRHTLQRGPVPDSCTLTLHHPQGSQHDSHPGLESSHRYPPAAASSWQCPDPLIYRMHCTNTRDHSGSLALALWLGGQHLLPHAASGTRASSPAGGCSSPCPRQSLTFARRRSLCGAGSRPQLPSITEWLPAASWQRPDPQPPGPQYGCCWTGCAVWLGA